MAALKGVSVAQISPTADREILVSRVFHAPRELVFKAWTDKQHVAEWFGPLGFSITVHDMDVRPGGVWRFVMHGPDGVNYGNTITFVEVKEPERLVYTHGSDTDDSVFGVTVTFVEEAGMTRLTLRQLYASAAEREYVTREYHAVEMANQTFDRLSEYLAAH
ncbi:MAG: SRPBCC family protein [Chloroflexota bacterium]